MLKLNAFNCCHTQLGVARHFHHLWVYWEARQIRFGIFSTVYFYFCNHRFISQMVDRTDYIWHYLVQYFWTERSVCDSGTNLGRLLFLLQPIT